MHEYLFIRKPDGLFTKLDSRIIVLIEASGGYSRIITTGSHYLVNSTLSQLEEILPAAYFCRVNRSCLVGIDHVSSFTVESIFIMDREVPLAKAYAEKFFERVKVVF